MSHAKKWVFVVHVKRAPDFPMAGGWSVEGIFSTSALAEVYCEKIMKISGPSTPNGVLSANVHPMELDKGER